MKATRPTAFVAAVLMSAPDDRHWGYDLSEKSGVRSGVLYPILYRMLDEGLLEDGWEDPSEIRAAGEKRPPRRYYRVTDSGRSELTTLLSRARARGHAAARIVTA
jgi:PadR family transcriptional regulator, regulatory protein PadR